MFDSANSIQHYFDQSDFRCTLGWTSTACKRAAARGDVIVVVDVFFFSTTTIAALEQGLQLWIGPHENARDGQDIPSDVNVALHREHYRGEGLSNLPCSATRVPKQSKWLLSSRYGGTCCLAASGGNGPVLLGALCNAAAIGDVLTSILEKTKSRVTIVACGSRWKPNDMTNFHASIEDFLGAGAILSRIKCDDKSAEARLCEIAFAAAVKSKEGLRELCMRSATARRICNEQGQADIEYSCVPDRHATVPIVTGGRVLKFSDS